jgi:hypothetical protein
VRRHFRTYSANNQFLIALQCQDATYVAGFRKWLQLGYAVRRGETSIRIWMPMPPSKKALAEWEAAGAVARERPKTRFRLGPVFDRSQVEPLPAPAEPVNLEPPMVRAEGDELEWSLPHLIELAGQAGYEVVFEPGPERIGGMCISGTRLLWINNRACFSINQQVKTMIHELSHMLLRVEREEDDLELTYSEEELVVESIAFHGLRESRPRHVRFLDPVPGFVGAAGVDGDDRARRRDGRSRGKADRGACDLGGLTSKRMGLVRAV